LTADAASGPNPHARCRDRAGNAKAPQVQPTQPMVERRHVLRLLPQLRSRSRVWLLTREAFPLPGLHSHQSGHTAVPCPPLRQPVQSSWRAASALGTYSRPCRAMTRPAGPCLPPSARWRREGVVLLPARTKLMRAREGVFASHGSDGETRSSIAWSASPFMLAALLVCASFRALPRSR
jgi:hypothetical protein